MIKENIFKYKQRKEIPKYKKEQKNSNSYLVNSKPKKIYEYYICDYCNDEIRLDTKKHERSGGIVSIPQSLTKRGKIVLALHNKCLNKVIKEFQD